MPLENLDDLEREWAEFMFDRPGKRGQWSQDQRWRNDNPGKLQQLLAYRAGGPRPDFSGSQPGSTERRMVEHVDAYLEAKREPDPPPPPPPPPSAPEYVHDYTAARGQTTPPDHGWDWGMQYTGGVPTSNFKIVPDGIAPGIPSGRMILNAGGTQSIEGLRKWPVVMGQTRFYGMMVKFPSNWVKPNDSGWGAAIAQLGYQGNANHTWGLFAHADHVQCIILSGEHTWPDPNKPGIGTPIREYDNSTDLGAWPNGPRAITSPMQLGAWHQLIIEIKWSTCSTNSRLYSQVGHAGHTRVWHRVMGGGAWNKTIEKLNIPTLQWGYGYDFDGYGVGNPPPYWRLDSTGSNTAHKFGLYAGGASFVRQIEHGRIVIGESFDSVAALMP